MSSATIDMERYRQWLAGRYSPETRRHYEQVARVVAQRAKGNLDGQVARSYLDDLANRSGARTVRLHRAALMNLAEFLQCDLNLLHYKLPRLPRRLPRYLNDSQLDRYVELVKKKVGSDRTRTILLLLPLVGLRISEICALQAKDVIRRGGDWSLRVVGKGDKERQVPLNSLAKGILTEYLRDGFVPGSKLFDVSPDAVRERLRGLRRDLGLPWLTPHKLRHTFATSLTRKDVNLKKIAKLLGHESITTTDIYAHVEDASCREAVERIVAPRH